MAYFTGDIDNVYTSEVFNGNYIFCQGVNVIKYWNQSDSVVSTLPGCSAYKCKAMLKIGERLCLYNTTEGATTYRQRVRWPAIDTPGATPSATDWTATGSGYSDLSNLVGSDPIQTATALDEYVAIYCQNHILLQEYKGDVNEPFAFYKRLDGVGLAAPRAIVDVDGYHFFLGYEDVYVYSGGRSVTSVASPDVRTTLFELINPQYINRCFMDYLREYNQIRLHFPTAGNTTPNKYWVYNLRTKGWSRGTRSYTGSGKYRRQSSYVINTLTNPINSYAHLRFNDTRILQTYPTRLYGNSSGEVFEEDPTLHSVAGTATNAYFVTKDFVEGEGYVRDETYWAELNIEAKGTSVDVSYSVDSGRTWSDAETVTLDGYWNRYRVDTEAYGSKIRYKFSNSNLNGAFAIRWIEIGYVSSSDRIEA